MDNVSNVTMTVYEIKYCSCAFLTAATAAIFLTATTAARESLYVFINSVRSVFMTAYIYCCVYDCMVRFLCCA